MPDSMNPGNVMIPDQLWNMEPRAFEAMVSRLSEMNWSDIDSSAPAIEAFNADRISLLKVESGVGIIPIMGPMTKRLSFFSFLFGGSSTDAIRLAVKQAADNPDIKSILLRIDSPGGSVDGLAELGDEVAKANKVKPVVAQVEGLAASAAYYVASQASKIVAARMDMIGSIGTRMMLLDISEQLTNQGVKVIPVDSGEFKSAGSVGPPVTDAHIAYFQSIVDAFAHDFRDVVIRGRRGKMTAKKVEEIADGRLFMASEALDIGLIDGISTIEKTLSDFTPLGRSRRTSASHKQLELKEKLQKSLTT